VANILYLKERLAITPIFQSYSESEIDSGDNELEDEESEDDQNGIQDTDGVSTRYLTFELILSIICSEIFNLHLQHLMYCQKNEQEQFFCLSFVSKMTLLSQLSWLLV